MQLGLIVQYEKGTSHVKLVLARISCKTCVRIIGKRKSQTGSHSRRPAAKRTRVSMETWNDVPVVDVDELPAEIDGTCIYRLGGSASHRKGISWNVTSRLPKHGRKWRKAQTANAKRIAKRRRKIRCCQGSYVCESKDCLFPANFDRPNNQYFATTMKDTISRCKFCEEVATYVDCTARKFTEFHACHTIVRHADTRTCHLVSRYRLPDEIKNMLKTRPQARHQSARDHFLVAKVKAGMPWEDLKKEAATVMDRDKYEYQKKKASTGTGNSLQAVKALQDAIKHDRHLIYTLASKDMTAIFKSSAFLFGTAVKMEKNGDHFLGQEYAFFDATRGRARDHVTFGIHVYHPLLRKLIRVATMESSCETTQAITFFFQTLNEAIQAIREDKGKTFNPYGLVCDEYGAKHIAPTQVYGKEFQNRVATCSFHYKQNLQRHARRLVEDEVDAFYDLGCQMLNAVSPPLYEEAYWTLLQFVKASSSREKSLGHWLDWWNRHEFNWAKAFRPGLCTPNSNLSEFSFQRIQT